MEHKSLKPAKPRVAVGNNQTVPSKGMLHIRGEAFDIKNQYERCALYGAALVAAEIFDSDFCVHGPQGCTSAIKEAFAVQGREYDYHHSGMMQSDIIFGGEKCLTKALTEAFTPYEKAGPKFMVTSCSSEIIGDNVDAVATKVNPRLPLVKVVGGGFKGNQYIGIDQALIGLMTKFADPRPERLANLVNLVGNIGLCRQWRGDLCELQRLLEGLGCVVNRVFCESTIEDIQRTSRASLTILLMPEVGVETAEYLKKRFGIPYCCSSMFLPLGLRGTEVWLKEIGEALSLPRARIVEFVEKEEERARGVLKVGLYQMTYVEKLSKLKGLPVSIIAEGSVAFSWARFLSEELEMKPVFLGMRTGQEHHMLIWALEAWAKETASSPKILFRPTLEEIKDAIKKTGTEFVFGSSVELDMAEELGVRQYLHITNPNTHLVSINRLPFLGYEGLLHATEAILNQLKP